MDRDASGKATASGRTTATATSAASGGSTAPAGTSGIKEPKHFGRLLPRAATGTEGTAGILSVPSAPCGVTATAGAGTSIVVTWTPDVDNGDHYQATTVPSSFGCTVMVASATTCTISTGLIPGTSYTVPVVAYDASNAASSAGTAGAVTTGAPTGVTATATAAGQVTVAWTPGAANGGIATYTVTSNPSSSGCTTADASTHTCAMTGLTPGTGYTFAVVANGAGSVGDSSASTDSASVSPGPPGRADRSHRPPRTGRARSACR